MDLDTGKLISYRGTIVEDSAVWIYIICNQYGIYSLKEAPLFAERDVNGKTGKQVSASSVPCSAGNNTLIPVIREKPDFGSHSYCRHGIEVAPVSLTRTIMPNGAGAP